MFSVFTVDAQHYYRNRTEILQNSKQKIHLSEPWGPLPNAWVQFTKKRPQYSYCTSYTRIIILYCTLLLVIIILYCTLLLVIIILYGTLLLVIIILCVHCYSLLLSCTEHCYSLVYSVDCYSLSFVTSKVIALRIKNICYSKKIFYVRTVCVNKVILCTLNTKMYDASRALLEIRSVVSWPLSNHFISRPPLSYYTSL